MLNGGKQGTFSAQNPLGLIDDDKPKPAPKQKAKGKTTPKKKKQKSASHTIHAKNAKEAGQKLQKTLTDAFREHLKEQVEKHSVQHFVAPAPKKKEVYTKHTAAHKNDLTDIIEAAQQTQKYQQQHARHIPKAQAEADAVRHIKLDKNKTAQHLGQAPAFSDAAMQHLQENLKYNTLWNTNQPPTQPVPEIAEKSILKPPPSYYLDIEGNPIDPKAILKRPSQVDYHENPAEAVAQDALYLALEAVGIVQFDEYTRNLFRKKYTTSQAITEGINTALSMGVPGENPEQGGSTNEINNTAEPNDFQPSADEKNDAAHNGTNDVDAKPLDITSDGGEKASSSTNISKEVTTPTAKTVEPLSQAPNASVGSSTSTNYRATFFEVNPELKGKVVVHHAVEQQVLQKYPQLFSESEIHSIENLRGIPNSINNDIHLSQIRRIWNQFYRTNPNPLKSDLLKVATEIDNLFGDQFLPPQK